MEFTVEFYAYCRTWNMQIKNHGVYSRIAKLFVELWKFDADWHLQHRLYAAKVVCNVEFKNSTHKKKFSVRVLTICALIPHLTI